MPPDPRPHLTFTLTPEDVGQRVAVRQELPNGQHSDVLGVLESWTEGTLTLRRRDGSVVEVTEGTLVAGKVIPPPPPKRRPRGSSSD